MSAHVIYPAGRKANYHAHDFVLEVRMSDCRYGCKIYRCRCGEETLIHSATYGCRGVA